MAEHRTVVGVRNAMWQRQREGRVEVYLADRADDNSSAAYPKIKTIVNVTELSERTVRSSGSPPGARVHPPWRPTVRASRQGRQEPSAAVLPGRRDLAVETDPSNLHVDAGDARRGTRSATIAGADVEPEAGAGRRGRQVQGRAAGEALERSRDSSSANLAGLENRAGTSSANAAGPALQISHLWLCKSRTSSSANLQGCIYKDKTLQVNPPCKPLPSLPSGELPASGKRPAEKDGKNETTGRDSEAVSVMGHLASVRSRLSLTTAKPTKRDLSRIGRLVSRIAEAHAGDHAAALALILAVIDWLPANPYWLRRVDSARRLADNWDRIANDWAVDPDRTPTRTGHRDPRPRSETRRFQAHSHAGTAFETARAFADLRARPGRYEASRGGIRPRGQFAQRQPVRMADGVHAACGRAQPA